MSRTVPYLIYSSQQPSEDGIIMKKQRFWERKFSFQSGTSFLSHNFLSSTATVRTVSGSWVWRWGPISWTCQCDKGCLLWDGICKLNVFPVSWLVDKPQDTRPHAGPGKQSYFHLVFLAPATPVQHAEVLVMLLCLHNRTKRLTWHEVASSASCGSQLS